MQLHQCGGGGRRGDREVFDGRQARGSSLVGSRARIDNGQDLARREGGRGEVRGFRVEEVRVYRVFLIMSTLSP